ncbi:MAG: HDIG domain-containing protein [Clostridia bacterium]|nr:HDIG domain-containing protein [Clostridia bacterium]
MRPTKPRRRAKRNAAARPAPGALPRAEAARRLTAAVAALAPDGWRRYGRRVRMALYAGASVALLAFLVASAVVPRRYDLTVGQVAPREIAAPRDFVDWPTTERLRAEAAGRVAPSFVQVPEAGEEARRAVERVFAEVARVRSQPNLRPAEVAEALRTRLVFDLPGEAYLAVASLSEEDLAALERDALRVVAVEMAGTIAPGDVGTFLEDARRRVRELERPASLTAFLMAVVEEAIRPNVVLDEAVTQEKRRRAAEAVEPVLIVQGEVFVRRGERLDADDIRRLQDAGLLGGGAWWRAAAGATGLTLLVVGAAGVFLRLFRPAVLTEERRFALLCLLVVGTSYLGTALLPVSPYLMPVAGAAMLASILFEPAVALAVAFVLTVLSVLVTPPAAGVGAVGAVGSLTAMAAVRRVTQRSDIIRAGFLVALAQACAVLAAGAALGSGGPQEAETWRQVGFAFANGVVLAGMLTIGFLPYAESFFGILTPVKLLELANPDQPLLRRLLLEAPGTYHHSLMVANLAEAAAEVVGGNGLLARVGAYFHDVGKLKRPYFFIENQMGGKNPHARLSPNLSALIITAHVREGVELARSYGLPEEIVRFIAEHHGTTLLSYFYKKALDQGVAGVTEVSFRYEGPRPRTKETAIVMLADSCEAAVRALHHQTPGRIEATVRRVVQERLADGQLDQSELTLRDVDAVAGVFTRILAGVYHARVEYPGADGGVPSGRPGADQRRAGRARAGG